MFACILFPAEASTTELWKQVIICAKKSTYVNGCVCQSVWAAISKFQLQNSWIECDKFLNVRYGIQIQSYISLLTTNRNTDKDRHLKVLSGSETSAAAGIQWPRHSQKCIKYSNDKNSANDVKKLNSMVWVRERTIPTEQPPLVGEVIANFCGERVPRGQLDGSLRPYFRFSRQEPLLFYQVAPQLLLLLRICSQ
jgi:hypothetical protein